MKTTKSLLALCLIVISCFTARAVVPDGAEADVVIGQQNANASNFVRPYVAVDPTTQKVFVADQGRHRILRFASAESLSNGAAAEAVLGQPDFTSIAPGVGPNRLNTPLGLWCDGAGRLWVSDTSNNRVLRFNNAASIGSGAPADGVLGQVNFTNSGYGISASTVTAPGGLVTDSTGNLYVADTSNNRVLRFNSAASLANGASASAVLGQPDFMSFSTGHDANQFASPMAVAISPNPVLHTQPYLWVADLYNHRVLRFNDASHITNGAAATRVLGQPDLTHTGSNLTASGMGYPTSLAADSSGRLYVGSAVNRVQRFDDAVNKANNAPADGVLGQAAFTTGIAGSGPGGLDRPDSLALGANGRLWIGDQSNNRVLRHEAAHTKVNGADSDGVIGAPTTTTDLTRVFRPYGIAIDPVSGKLFVADELRNRVLRFASAQSLASGAGAEAVFGQADFSGRDEGTAANRMKDPWSLAMDSLGNLFVLDRGNNRVLRFNNAAQRPSGVGADGVLGQQNFNTGTSQPLSATAFPAPESIAIGPSNVLWVSHGRRVMRFDNASTKSNGAPADGVLGQSDFAGDITSLDASHFAPRGVAADAGGRLWVNDLAHYRILRFDNAAARTNGAPADGVFGQDDFNTANNGGLGPDGIYAGELFVEPGGRLWYSESISHRVIRWEHAATRPNGADADGVLGQPDFGFGQPGNGPGQFYSPLQMARDSAGHLWVVDINNYRILRFSSKLPRLALARKNASTLTLTLDQHVRGVSYRFESSLDLQLWITGDTYLPPSTAPVLFDFPIPSEGRGFFRVIED